VTYAASSFRLPNTPWKVFLTVYFKCTKQPGKMAVLHRALFTWFIILIFLILVVLRLEQRVRWSWFIVFVPMWLYDCILLIYLIFLMGSHRRMDRWQRRAVRHVIFMGALILKVSAEILLCLRLEGSGMKLYYMMIPVWIGLPILTLDVFLSLFDTDILEFVSNLRSR